MSTNRRLFLKSGLAATIGTKWAMALPGGNDTPQVPGQPGPVGASIRKVSYKRIATEEAWGPQEMFDLYRRLLSSGASVDVNLAASWGGNSLTGRNSLLVERLLDIGERRIKDMDAAGTDIQILS